jgi:kinetochore protein Mis13/DSN1
VQQKLEFQTDVFAHGIHGLEMQVEGMEEVAGRVLALSAARLEEREGRERERAGTGGLPVMEVLRALSRVMPGGSG